MAIVQPLPRQEFVNCQRVALARLFQAQKATADSSDELSFAPDYPAFCNSEAVDPLASEYFHPGR